MSLFSTKYIYIQSIHNITTALKPDPSFLGFPTQRLVVPIRRWAPMATTLTVGLSETSQG